MPLHCSAAALIRVEFCLAPICKRERSKVSHESREILIITTLIMRTYYCLTRSGVDVTRSGVDDGHTV